MWPYLLFVLKEGRAKILPASNWHKCILDLVTVEQCLVKRQQFSNCYFIDLYIIITH